MASLDNTVLIDNEKQGSVLSEDSTEPRDRCCGQC
jgi:hypothetical protein